MNDRQASDAPAEKNPAGGEKSVRELWAEAAKAFEEICGESLQKGEVKGFDDVQKKIEGASKVSYGLDAEPEAKWEKVKSVGLESLKYLKMLVGAAVLASELIPIPPSAVNIASAALCFVFDIPVAIKGYNDAVNEVFSEVSSALSQFQIYMSMDNVNPLLIRKIHLVMVSFVKLCAHVVRYRQGRRRDHFRRQLASVFQEDSGLEHEMAEFRRAVQHQRDVEGTITLAVAIDTQYNVAILLEKYVIFAKTTEETHQLVQETQKDMQSFKDDADRSKSLGKIRDTLNVPATVRLDTNTTQTCTNIADRCLNRTGSWIWEHDAYTAWTAPNKDKETSHVLVLSGPPSSGKTSASALITKRLEEKKGRTYVAHYFFPASTKKNDDEKTPVQSALKYMAFQIARVDATVLKPLAKACETGPGVFRRSASSETLDTLWGELKIGTPGSNATYYLVFDGIENLPDKQTEMLLKFVFSTRLTEESSGRVRVLVSGTNDLFSSRPGGVMMSSTLRIRMEENNGSDMRIVIDEALTKRGMLEHSKSRPDQRRARDKIIEKLPQNVNGSYFRLHFGLDDVIRLLSTRTAAQELDRMLDQPMSSHEAAIKNLQRSLTADEISELNELLKWVLFCNEPMTLESLEAAMFLYSSTESLASLQFIIKNKYSAVLKIEDGFVYGQDGVKDYLQKDKGSLGKSSHSKDQSTISMTITINNVEQEICGHFLWDLAQKAIRDKFKFDFDASYPHNGLHSSQAAITVDEFDANRTIVDHAFQYLSEDPMDQTKAVGRYLVAWLPYHLGRLRQLEDEDKGILTPNEQLNIGENLYKIFKDEQVFLRHKESFEQTMWFANEDDDVQKWLMDSAIVRRLDKKWRDEVQRSGSPIRGFLKGFVKIVVEGLLRKRSWPAENAFDWIYEFMKLDRKFQQHPEDAQTDEAEPSWSPDNIDWDRVSSWCQGFLGLPDSELNSLWYERLAEASFSAKCKADTVLSLYQRAIEKGNPSWMCHRGLGITQFDQSRIEEAIVQVELALEEAKREGATPKPEAKDIVELHLLLGNYSYKAGDAQKAAEHSLFACNSEDPAQAKQAQLGYLKAGLGFPDAEATRQLLKGTFTSESGDGTLVNILKMVARDTDHDDLIPKMFTVAKGDPDLLKAIVRVMEAASAITAPNDSRTVQATEDDLYAEDEARGVLLYDRGVAAYRYNVSPDGTEPVDEALRLWRESSKLLRSVGGQNAFTVRQDATTALAQHYFQNMVDGKHLNHVGALIKLAEADSTVYYNNAVGFLGTVYALQGEKEKARATLSRWISQGLQILSDDRPDNDASGYLRIQKTLEQYQDFKNAAIAMFLSGQPDLVLDALSFEAKEIPENDGVDKERLFNMVTKLAKETIQVAKDKVPDSSQQVQRIEAAEAHVDFLITKSKSEAHNDSGTPAEGSAGQDVEAKLVDAAHGLLHARLSALQQKYTPNVGTDAMEWFWTCDGRTPDGRHCKNRSKVSGEFYHCLYCSNKDFCRDCLSRLRNPDSGADITACSAKHRWLLLPAACGPMYVGLKAKSVRAPKEVRPTEHDESILEVLFDENDGGGEIAVEEWKENLAKEWGMSIEEIKKGMSRQATPEGDKQGEKKGEE